ncbi:SbcC/MukB-like Walker B domain-containing protein, partial [Craterilacuibacter sp.]|uniref:SbcC/MukB-like Walker B domain-containing protein n=1 Tax=Craterilacuibacter sp. TaxID=2870909 RepID=UPI003F3CE8DF
ACDLADKALQQAREAGHQADAQHSKQLQQLALAQQETEGLAMRLADAQAGCERLQAELGRQQQALTAALAVLGYAVPDETERWLAARVLDWQHWQQGQKQLDALRLAHEQQQSLVVNARQYADERQQHARALGVGCAANVVLADVAAALTSCMASMDAVAHALATLFGQQGQLAVDAARQHTVLDTAAKSWLAALAGSVFADAAGFLAALLPPDERQRLLALREQLAKDHLQATALLKSAQHARTALEAAPLGVLALEALEAQLATLLQARQDLALQQGGISVRLAEDAARRQKQQALLRQIDVQAADVELWQRLDGLIGSARGDKFRKFAQGLTLDHLVYLANRQLQRLHGRYLLQRKDAGELELEIVDSWQGDAARDTRTLSGGESFLVSLALALALSDLVSHKTSIDSLFLDEGFGTLDAETLELALDALDSLNASGKMIGVISHVDAMKERILLQIRVQKAVGIGFSEIRIVP